MCNLNYMIHWIIQTSHIFIKHGWSFELLHCVGVAMRNVAIAQLIDISWCLQKFEKKKSKNKQTNRGMQVSNKIKLWCACCNAITTEMNLMKWELPVDKTCDYVSVWIVLILAFSVSRFAFFFLFFSACEQ